MADDVSRSALRQVVQRGGAVSAGALVVMLASGSFALASGARDAVSDPATSLGTPTTVPVGGLKVPQPVPLPAPVNGVVKAVTKTATSLTGQDSKPPTGGRPPTTPAPGGSNPKPTKTGGKVHEAARPTQHVTTVSNTANRGTAAQLRAEAMLGSVGNFAGQQTNASITPQLAPRSLSSLLPSADYLGNHGVPGALVVIATAGLAAVGASHLGIWYNRRTRNVPAG
jgi:hypothetical protein